MHKLNAECQLWLTGILSGCVSLQLFYFILSIYLLVIFFFDATVSDGEIRIVKVEDVLELLYARKYRRRLTTARHP